jgi:erythromycin esterase
MISESDSFVPKEVTTWFKSVAIPIDTTTPGRGFDDLNRLQSSFRNARIVAIGEATHGSREFFQMKHRLMEFLVERMGFTALGIEANWPESLAVNDYTLNGTGEPAKALAGLYFWTWNTEELLSVIRWMRKHNEDSTHTKKIKFFGFDLQVTHLAARNVIAYFEKVDRTALKTASRTLTALNNPCEKRRDLRTPAESYRRTARAIDLMLARFDKRKEQYVNSSSLKEWTIARHHLEIVHQAQEMYSAGSSGYFSVRDRSMAKNINWILDHEPPQTKLMLWAHNEHITTQRIGSGEPMGSYLRKKFGAEMVVCGFSFNHGSFQAIQHGKGPSTFAVDPAKRGSLDSALAAVGLSIFAVDLRNAPTSGVVGNWLNTPQPMRSIGAVYDEDMPETFFASVYPRSFDVLFFVNHTTAAHQNPQ